MPTSPRPWSAACARCGGALPQWIALPSAGLRRHTPPAAGEVPSPACPVAGGKLSLSAPARWSEPPVLFSSPSSPLRQAAPPVGGARSLGSRTLAGRPEHSPPGVRIRPGDPPVGGQRVGQGLPRQPKRVTEPLSYAGLAATRLRPVWFGIPFAAPETAALFARAQGLR